MILVSHDFRLINQVAENIWVCENRTVTPWVGGIQAYKASLKEKVMTSDKNVLAGKSADHNLDDEFPKMKVQSVRKPAPKSLGIEICRPKTPSVAAAEEKAEEKAEEPLETEKDDGPMDMWDFDG